jgi:hypothetical protein
MDETEWLACNSPEPMLEFLQGKASDRKLRLFGCACCRVIWPSVEEQASREAVVVAERYADSEVGRNELHSARRAAGKFGLYRAGWVAAYCVVGYRAWHATRDTIWHATGAAAPPSREGRENKVKTIHCRFIHFLRDIFGDPFHPVTLEPAWRTTNVVSLAQAAYDDRILPGGTLDPDRLAVLADALEDAGCDSADILSHLRGPGPHFRGCWVVDAILLKE